MLNVQKTRLFMRDLEKMEARGVDVSKIDPVVELLAQRKPLPPKYRDHALRGNWIGYRECHIEPDWLLIYFINGKELTLVLSRTGSHSDFRF